MLREKEVENKDKKQNMFAALFVVIFGVRNELRYRELSAIVSPYYSVYSMDDYSRGDVDSVTVAHLYTLFSSCRRTENKAHTNQCKAVTRPWHSTRNIGVAY